MLQNGPYVDRPGIQVGVFGYEHRLQVEIYAKMILKS